MNILRHMFRGDALVNLKRMAIKIVIVNSIGYFIGAPIWLLSISWALNVYFLAKIIKGVRQNTRTHHD